MKELLYKLLTPSFYRRAGKIGKWTIVIVATLLALNHWIFVPLEFKLPKLWINLFFIYLIINAAAASPFIYLKQKERKIAHKLCPRCGQELEKITEYECEKCGRLRFEKEREC